MGIAGPVTAVVMLDVDGVLNSARFFDGRAVARRGEPLRLMVERIDPDAVARLNRIDRACAPVFVLSSDWRNEDRWPRVGPGFVSWMSVAQALRRHGFQGRLVGRTPLPSEVRPGVFARYRGRLPGPFEPVCRGYEIQQWLDEHPGVRRLAILDDVPGEAFAMAHLEPWLVQTDGAVGLTDGDVRRALALLAPAGVFARAPA